MAKALGKWEQSLLLKQHPITAASIPETTIYSKENLDDFLSRHPYVYVKHNSTGQGRAILKVEKKGEVYHLNGFTIQGTPIQRFVSGLDEFHRILHPFERFGRLSGLYIIQEGIQSFAKNGRSVIIRVHVQKLKGEWIIGGMLGRIGPSHTVENGIVNAYRGATVMTIAEVIESHSLHNEKEKIQLLNKIETITFAAAKTINAALTCREFGIDFGLNQSGQPILFEVNTTPGIGGFAQFDDKSIWKRIVAIRKIQNESDEY